MIQKILLTLCFLLFPIYSVASTTYVLPNSKVEFYEMIHPEAEEGIVILWNENYSSLNTWMIEPKNNILQYLYNNHKKSIFVLSWVDSIRESSILNDINISLEMIKHRHNIKSFQIVGYSFGATVGYKLSIMNPSLYSSVTLINGLYMDQSKFKNVPFKYHLYYNKGLDGIFEINANFLYDNIGKDNAELYEVKCSYNDLFNELMLDEYYI